jgi:sugar diacid utilization regulator
VFWDRFQIVAERTLSDAALCWEVIKAARVRLQGNAARLSELFRRACEREFSRVGGIDDDFRLRAALRALEGQWVDPAELGYDLASHHIAVVADTASPLEDVARRTAWQLLQVRAPDGGVWGWLGARTRISEDDLDDLIASQSSRDVTISFGEPAEGIAGFAASHHQALEARAVAAATNRRTVRFADCRLLIAVLRDGDLARGFIDRELGDLDRPSERMRELRETLRAYLEHSQSVSATAALRRRDRKTIERQLRAAEQLIQHRVSDRSDEVLIALRVAEILRSGNGH